MGVAWLDEGAMNRFRDRSPDDPGVVVDRKIKQYAEEQGGEVLAYWRWAMGRIWDDPFMMTDDEVSKRLGMPEDRLNSIFDATMKACGYAKPKPVGPAS